MRVARVLLLLALALPAGLLALDRLRLQTQARELRPGAQALVRGLLELVDQGQTLPAGQRVRRVNDYFNQRLRWRDDAAVWGQVDYWASPLELLDKGEGDCEDLAMAKYFALLALGVPEAHLRLVYVRAQYQGRAQAHMVLAWYPELQGEPWILDNIKPELQRAGERADLAPVFSFNAEGLWQGVGSQDAGNPLARLSLWRDALARARDQGF